MQRLRGIIAGILMLAGALFAAEYYLRTHTEISERILKQNELFSGWTPSQTLYLLPPKSRVIKQVTDQGKAISVRYDANGFRVSQEASPQKNHILLLGDQYTLAADQEYDETFPAIWQKMQNTHLQKFSLQSGRFLNAGQPHGCPLLWLLQDSARFRPLQTPYVLCVIDPQIFLNDFLVRRTITFDENGIPLAGKHPYAQATESKQPEKFGSLLQSQLARLGLPLLYELFFSSDEVKKNPLSQANLRTDLINSSERKALQQRTLLPLLELRKAIRSRGGELLIIYIPDLEEIQKLQSEQQVKQPQMILTKTERTSSENRKRLTFRGSVRRFAIEQKFRLCDTSDFLLKEQNPKQLYSLGGSLLSAKGHQKIAEILRDYFSAKTAESRPQLESR